jgi:7-cyano-7-deazaguanine synthase in queuosine biosynthesis
MARNVVIWSGGLDSTAILYMAGMLSTKENPVITLSVKEHHRCNAGQMRAQSIARHKYLRFAKSIGHFIQAQEISVSGNAVGDLMLRQHHLWPSLFQIYFQPEDIVSWGYKKGEPYQEKDFLKLLNSFNSFADNLEGARRGPIRYAFPLKNIDNVQLIKMLMSFEIPMDCMFCCNTPIGIVPCDSCDKCKIKKIVYDCRSKLLIDIADHLHKHWFVGC